MILHIPHSSIVIPKTDTYLRDTTDEINRVTDWYTDELFCHAGYHRLVFPYSRLYCDVERFIDDPLDEKGLGIYYTKCLDGNELRKEDAADREEVMKRYHEHHLNLANYVNQYISYFDKITIVDAHSYSNEQASYMGKGKRPDFCIGTDSFHTPEDMVFGVCDRISNNGFTWEINDPFEGTMNPQFFYRKNACVQSIMIEVNKQLYLTEDYKKSPKFDNVKTVISSILDYIYDITLPEI